MNLLTEMPGRLHKLGSTVGGLMEKVRWQDRKIRELERRVVDLERRLS